MEFTRRSAVSCMLGVSLSLALSCLTAQAAPAGGGVAWTTYQDPYERAFTLDVPRGWAVKGGMYRLGYSDARPMVDMHSPDGKIEIRLGDLSVPVYAAPSQFHSHEGEVYDLGAQGQMIVARYHTGPEYAALYAEGRFNGVCSNPSPDTASANSIAPNYGVEDGSAKQASTGQISYRCNSKDGPRVAFAYVKTANFGVVWGVPDIASYVAAPEAAAAARTILLHAAQSFRLSQQWLQYKARMDAEGLEYQRARQQGRMRQLQQQVQQFETRMQAMKDQASAFEQHMARERSQFQGMDDAINGLTPTTDPLTGETRKVWTGTQDGYWVNGVGQVVNSNGNPNPNQNWHQLQVGQQ